MGQEYVYKVKYFLNLCLNSFVFSSTVCPAFPDGKVAATLLSFTTKIATRTIRLSLALNYCAAPVTCISVVHLFLLITRNDNLIE